METIEYHTIDKSTWGDGPWQNEPDKVFYQDEETGFPCLIRRHPEIGNFCGYVGVHEDHPCFKKDYDSIEVRVHGGLTFAGFMGDDGDKTDPPSVWWLGFDCAHYMDFSPGLAATLIDLGLGREKFDIYRDIAYVKAQIASLAKQLKALTNV